MGKKKYYVKVKYSIPSFALNFVLFPVIEKCQRRQMNSGNRNLHALALFIRLAFKKLKQVRRITVVTQGISESETNGCLETV